MFRVDLSKPIVGALAHSVLQAADRVFDYGCGRGSDVALLSQRGFDACGWDPVHAPAVPKRRAEVVNLGYVVNVIEDPSEREATLHAAWHLAKRVLIVAARLDWDLRITRVVPCRDGVVTQKGTFQKFFTQDELRSWIESTLGVEPVAAGPGIFYVFRTDQAREEYLSIGARCVYDRIRIPPLEQLKANRELLEPLIVFLTQHGRAPAAGEFDGEAGIRERFGSVTGAVALLSRALEERPWEDVALARQRDLLVYLALGTFRPRPPLRSLPGDLQADIRAFFGSYKEGVDLGRDLLFSMRDQAVIAEECGRASVGKLTSDALYVHVSALAELPTLLRVYEGCARTLLGEVPGATLVKLRRDKPKVSYLSYPTFDRRAHPALAASYVADLRALRTNFRDYSTRENPPILHRKECFVGANYPGREKFTALTLAEDRRNLLKPANDIGTREQWEERLTSRGFTIRGHRLNSVKPRLNVT